MKSCFILGAAPCLEEDLKQVDLSTGKVIVVNRAGLRYLGHIDYWCSAHPEHFQANENWYQQRKDLGGNTDFKGISTKSASGVHIVQPKLRPATGSSAFPAVLWALQNGFEKIILCGVPLSDEYHIYRDCWKKHYKVYEGKVSSVSGWTKEFFGAPK